MEDADRRPLGPQRSRALAAFVADAVDRDLPHEIITAAKTALVDHVGVALGGMAERAALGARQVAEEWRAPGNARILAGPRTRAALAAFVNGTAAHAMDFDDTHAGGSGHISAPVWSTALALASDLGRDERAAIRAFVTGYEVMARLGGGGTGGIGKALQARGFHPTGINGVIGAAAAAASLMQLDEGTAAHALGLAATSAGGLVASFGTDAKAYHAGRAAWNGIIAAELAANGVQAARDAFEVDGGLLAACIQDGEVSVPALSFDHWELSRNGYKAYACCRAAHASILAAQKLAPRIAGRRIDCVRARVHWSAQFTASIMEPRTPLEAKFSVAYCVAAALTGRDLTLQDFEEPTLSDTALQSLTRLVEIQPVRDQPQKEAHVEVSFEDGARIDSSVDCFLGHPDNPMSEERFTAKFISLAAPSLGHDRAEQLLDTLGNFERPGSLKDLNALCAPDDT